MEKNEFVFDVMEEFLKLGEDFFYEFLTSDVEMESYEELMGGYVR